MTGQLSVFSVKQLGQIFDCRRRRTGLRQEEELKQRRSTLDALDRLIEIPAALFQVFEQLAWVLFAGSTEILDAVSDQEA